MGNLLHTACQFKCCCLVTQSCPTLYNPMDCSVPGFMSFAISWSLLKLMPIELVMLSNYLLLCHPVLLLPSIFPSIRVFSNKSALCITWPKYLPISTSFSLFYFPRGDRMVLRLCELPLKGRGWLSHMVFLNYI